MEGSGASPDAPTNFHNEFPLPLILCLSGVQSSTPLSQSQARKEEGWRQEGHPAVKEVLQNPQESSHVMNVSGKT